MSDPLSEILALADARCVITGGLRAGGEWALRSQTNAMVKLDAVIGGSCWLIVEDLPPLRLGAGDAVVLNGLESVVLCSDPRARPVEVTEIETPAEGFFARLGSGDDVTVIGGHIDLDPGAAGLFRSALPAVTHAAASSAEAAEMRRLLEQVIAETAGGRPGAGFAADQHAQLLLLQILRVGLQDQALSHPGWLRLLADRQLRPAVSLMHSEPARHWGLVDLAKATAMSRSLFSRRFREVSGQPPLAYLSRWRIHLAERALRTSAVTVAALAQHLGYASESSFSHAFIRVAGTSPGRYRRDAAARVDRAEANPKI